MDARLICISGKDEGTVFRLEEDRTFRIGRARDCDFRLKDASVSRTHCKVRCEAGKTVLKHISKTNPTTINGKQVTVASLKHMDAICIGETTLQFLDPSVSEHAEDRKTKPAEPTDAGYPPLPGIQTVFKAGDRVGAYEILKRVGSGQSTTVYKVRDLKKTACSQ